MISFDKIRSVFTTASIICLVGAIAHLYIAVFAAEWVAELTGVPDSTDTRAAIARFAASNATLYAVLGVVLYIIGAGPRRRWLAVASLGFGTVTICLFALGTHGLSPNWVRTMGVGAFIGMALFLIGAHNYSCRPPKLGKGLDRINN